MTLTHSHRRPEDLSYAKKVKKSPHKKTSTSVRSLNLSIAGDSSAVPDDDDTPAFLQRGRLDPRSSPSRFEDPSRLLQGGFSVLSTEQSRFVSAPSLPSQLSLLSPPYHRMTSFPFSVSRDGGCVVLRCPIGSDEYIER